MPTTEETIILLSSHDHNLSVLAPLLRQQRPTCQEPETLHTPLHKAILGAAQYLSISDCNLQEEKMKLAEQTVRLLLENGAIWNDLNREGKTPGCVADEKGLKGLYEIMVDAGVRAELLFSRLDGYISLGGGESGGEDEEEEEQGEKGDKEMEEEVPALVPAETAAAADGEPKGMLEEDGKGAAEPEWKDPNPVTSPAYLSSRLTYHPDKLLDADSNGVMMSWETDIMRRTVELLLPPTSTPPSFTTTSGPRVLNIGFGMGIIDTLFQSHSPPPQKHTIIEAHPDVLTHHLHATSPWRTNPTIEILPGRWQDVLPPLITRGEIYDAIYFDTFAEDYSALRDFFTEYVIALLNPEGGRFGFFNGLGADRRISYDVYRKIAEMDLFEAGLETKWEVVRVGDLDKEVEWEGVKRKYWCLDEYWLPVCTFLGELEEGM
ncbi:arginine N-methyltransferase 2 [Terfezia boudieri ATCC MYA-4762]|uniref:Arginine N-methyltransferase 2 n=1 Tax=Terfezia boudieri ATCC MYA-4762 TaxID=1051890 RepID=A0A3N4M3S2_9PEZI|nr:arginine N-methyltransferase 2 [Terfezia boudieri ATCC MYA-4762]